MTGLWTTCKGESLHDALGRQMRWNRQRGPAPGLRFKPGTHFTNGEHLFEVVYGCQGLGQRPAGWVAAVRTDYADGEAPERYCYSLFSWVGAHRDGVIITGKSSILRLVGRAPRVFADASPNKHARTEDQ